MRIKTDEEGRKGDQRVVVICKCANPSQKDNNRYAFAQEIIEGQKPTIPKGSCLVTSRIIFLSQTIQPEDKEIFLLNVTHPAINQSTPSELMKSAAHALLVNTEDLKIEEYQHVAEIDKEFFNEYLASAPTYEEIMKAEEGMEQGAT